MDMALVEVFWYMDTGKLGFPVGLIWLSMDMGHSLDHTV